MPFNDYASFFAGLMKKNILFYGYFVTQKKKYMYIIYFKLRGLHTIAVNITHNKETFKTQKYSLVPDIQNIKNKQIISKLRHVASKGVGAG